MTPELPLSERHAMTEKVKDEDLASYRPRTELGRRLLEIQKRIVASGVPLLDWKGIAQEVAERRGGADPDEQDADDDQQG